MKKIIGIIICMLFIGVSVSSAISVDTESTISNNQNKECRDCKEISNADLIIVERLLDKVEFYSKLLSVLSLYHPELMDISKDLLDLIKYDILWDLPVICSVLENVASSLWSIHETFSSILEKYPNNLILNLIISPIGITVLTLYWYLIWFGVGLDCWEYNN